LQIRFTGTLGVLIDAKRAGLTHPSQLEG